MRKIEVGQVRGVVLLGESSYYVILSINEEWADVQFLQNDSSVSVLKLEDVAKDVVIM